MKIITTQGVVGSSYPDASANTWEVLEVIEEVLEQGGGVSGGSTVNFHINSEYHLSPFNNSLEAGVFQL